MQRKGTYKRQALTQLLIVISIILVINIISSAFFTRIDLTDDRRFTLTDSTRTMLSDLDDVVFVKVYLKGDFPAGFKRLSTSTKEMLDEFKVYGSDNIQYQFINPSEGKTEKELENVMKELAQKGLEPTNVQVKGGDEYSQKLIFPGAIINYKGKEAAINLLENTPGVAAPGALNNSVAHLEYNLSKAIRSLTFLIRPKIGFIQGHGELEAFQVTDLLEALTGYYEVQSIDLVNEINIPASFKTIVVAKPVQNFSEKDKFKIDQYIMSGGSVLWLLETLNAELDSVVTKRSFLTYDYPLNLEDQLFRYGIRVNPDLLMDLQCNPVPLLVSMENQQPDFKLFPCFYFPVFTPAATHMITQNTDAVAARFSSTIDTVVLSSVKKTVLLHSSDKSRVVFTPWLVDFRDLRNRPNPSDYNKRNLITAVLLEGTFPSVFKNRLTPEMETVLRDSLKLSFKEQSVPAKMVVISDGDVVVNSFNSQGQPYPLGYYQYTGEYFGNKNFLLNCIDYLTGFPQLLETRSKTLKLRLLNEAEVKESKLQWQLINMLAPLIALLFFGLIFNFIRSRTFGKIV